ncbi:sialate O-acetylesterase [Sorangium sp. So ce1024]|uniref:sialate O-acetylesterase n=1 Tax=unclassified Sorangium TaxID=2621164 RepID=UPI003F0B33FA
MTEMNRTLRGTPRFLLLPFLFIIAASGCGESDTPGGSDNTGGAGAGTGGGTASSTSAGTGGGATTGTGGGTASSTSAGAGGDASGGTTSASSGGGTGGAPSSNPTFHIFMLMGQSNMAGVADKQDSDLNTDERLKVLGGCNQPAGQWNVANPPLSDCPGEKGWNLSTAVDPGIWFGKTLLEKLPEGDTIGLIGTAESGESINTFISGGSHHAMILRKISQAKTAPNARFAGIIFHQGESDNGQSSWPGKVVQLYNEVKAAWGVDYDVPFILGELPAGGCCSGHNNLVHQAADMLPKGYWVTQQGTNVMDQYHFDHASVVLMGKRYGEKMIEALGW